MIEHSPACYIFVPLKTWRARQGRKPRPHCRKEEKLRSVELDLGPQMPTLPVSSLASPWPGFDYALWDAGAGSRQGLCSLRPGWGHYGK